MKIILLSFIVFRNLDQIYGLLAVAFRYIDVLSDAADVSQTLATVRNVTGCSWTAPLNVVHKNQRLPLNLTVNLS